MIHIIRQYAEDDMGGVLSSWESANKVAHPFLPKLFVDKVRDDIPKLYIPNADVWVADVNGKVVGFIALIGNKIGAIFVESELHGKGLGRALMNKACSLHESLELEVFKKNPIGRKFYEAYGFKYLCEKEHAETGEMVFRLAYQA